MNETSVTETSTDEGGLGQLLMTIERAYVPAFAGAIAGLTGFCTLEFHACGPDQI